MFTRLLLTGFLAVLATAAPLSFTVSPTIVASGTVTDAVYAPLNPLHNGVVRLSLNNGAGFCSGSAISATAILTAGHCLTNSAGVIDISTVGIELFDFNLASYSTYATTSDFLLHPSWTGNLITGVDLAIIRIQNALPSSITTYQLFTGNPLNQVFDVVGHGRTGSNGTGFWPNLGFRTGQNIWDGTLQTMAANGVIGAPNRTDVLLADFDNGTGQNNAWGAINAAFSNTGVPNGREATTAPGDSGGASFLNGFLAGVTSFGLRFTNPGIDVDESLNSSFGEFAGMTSVAAHRDWIIQSANLDVPEPGSLLLAGTALALLIGSRRWPGIRRPRQSPRH